MMRRLDRRGRISFVDLTDPQASCPANRNAMLARFHAMEDGRLLSGAGAFAAMWRAVPLLAPLGQLARLPLVLKLLELAYVRFLAIRPRLQRLLK